MTSRKKRKPAGRKRLALYAKRLALLAATLVVCGLLLEGFVLLVFGEQPKFPRHTVSAPWKLRYNDPNTHYRHKSADVCVYFRINAQGMRADRDYRYEKPAGTRRVVCLGDSFTVGYEVAVEDCYTTVLRRQLEAAGRKVEVLNAGVSGFGLAEQCLYLERELLKYDPDVVVATFFTNDLVDTLRSGLFSLAGGKLEPAADGYRPLGGFADWLNRSRLFNFLSERSNAFCWARERSLNLLRRKVLQQNLRNVEAAEKKAEKIADDMDYQQRLCVAVLERIHATTRDRGIDLIVLVIPHEVPSTPRKLVDVFPWGKFPFDRDGLFCLDAAGFLAPYVNRKQLYWERSHNHWTPLSHALAGKALAKLILERNLLPPGIAPAPKNAKMGTLPV